MPATWTVGAYTGSQPGKGDEKLAAGFKTPGKEADPQVAVEAKVSGDETAQGKTG